MLIEIAAPIQQWATNCLVIRQAPHEGEDEPMIATISHRACCRVRCLVELLEVAGPPRVVLNEFSWFANA